MDGESIIESESELEALYGPANPNSLAKEAECLTPAYQQWIEQAPFLAIASLGAAGLDCSPRGDEAGSLFRVLDASTIAIPDRPGNNRLDTLRNIVTDPRIALLFLIPGSPVTVLVVTIQTIYFQCGKSLLRSKLWDVDSQASSENVPTAGEMLKSVMSDFDSSAYDDALAEKQPRGLY